jgi:hypothetical protein
MQKEVLSILEGVALDRASLREQIASLRSEGVGRMTLEEIHRAIGEGRP